MQATRTGSKKIGIVRPQRFDADLDLLPGALDRRDPEAARSPQQAVWYHHLARSIIALKASFAAALDEESAYGHAFYWAPVWLGTGSVLWFSAEEDPSSIAYSVALLMALGTWHLAGAHRPALRFWSLAAALMVAGALCAAWETARSQTILLDSAVTTTVSGIVLGREADANGRWRYQIRVLSTEDPVLKRPPRIVKITATGKERSYTLGEGLTGRARLSPPSGPALAGLNDFAFAAFYEGTGGFGYFYGEPHPFSPGERAPTEGGALQSVLQGLDRLRGGISDHIRAVLPGDTGAFAASMVTDDRRALSKKTAEALRLAGLAHIIAISGLNMALAAGIFFVGLRAALSLSQEISHRFQVKKIAAGGALVTVTAYYLISGFAVSAERAYIMMAIMLVAVFFGRPSISLRNVALSAIAILILSPSAIMGPGFQMSYAATLGLVAGYAAWQKRGDPGRWIAGIPALKPLIPVWKLAAGIFTTSLIGGLSTALYSVEHFHRLAAWGLPANLMAMPIISFIVMPAGLLALILMPFGLDWLPLMAMGFGLDLVIAIANWAASQGGDVVVGRIPAWLFVGLTCAFLLMAILRTRLRLSGLALAALLLSAWTLMPEKPRPDVVIFEDGRLVAIRAGETLFSNQAKPSDFIFEQWQRALGLAIHAGPEMAKGPGLARKPETRRRLSDDEIMLAREQMLRDLAKSAGGRFLCRSKQWCAATLSSGMTIIVVENGAYAGAACDNADIVVTSARLKWQGCRSGGLLFTGATLRHSGSVELYLRDKGVVQVVTAFDSARRPWMVHRIYDWKTGLYQDR